MATNVVSSVMQFLTPDIISRIASALGLDRSKAQSAIGAAVPGLLAGLSHVAEQPGGEQKLAEAARQQGDVLGRIGSMLSGGGQSLIDKGTSMLSSLLGTRDETALADAVGTYAGMNRSTSESLLGMLAPVVMGTIAKEKDGGGIAGFLARQKDSIVAALPSGFKSLLGGTGLIDLPGTTARATAAPSQTATRPTTPSYAYGDQYGDRSYGDTRYDTRRTTRADEGPSYRWLYWAIPLLAAAGLLWYLLSQTQQPTTTTTTPGTTTTTTGEQPSLIVNGTNVGNQVTESMGTLRNTLSGITDATTAQNALPQLRQVATQVDQIATMSAQMTPQQRSTLATLINQGMPALNDLQTRLLAMPGVGPILRPVLNPMMTKLRTIATS